MWLASVGGIQVERITDVKRSFSTADKSPPKGVLHTTEGGWSSSLSVFRYNTGTPTFMLGRDGTTKSGVSYNGRLRLAQFMPVGEMSLTLENLAGGGETNRDCIVQIELVAFSQRSAWLPDDETTALLKALMLRLSEPDVNIPLRRGGDGTRSVTKWMHNAGWFGHSEVPENNHWDPGAIKWNELFAQTSEAEVFPEWYQKWKPWYIVGKPNGVPMPPIVGVPSPIPQWAWDDINLTVQIHKLLGPPIVYQNWRNFRLLGSKSPENLPSPIPEQWWAGAVIDHQFANAYADKADDPLQAELATRLEQVVSLQNELASVRNELEVALKNGSEEVAQLRARMDEVTVMLNEAIAKLS